MDDLKQKATRGLKCCIESLQSCECPDGCPYEGRCWADNGEYKEDADIMYLDLMRDALSLLTGPAWISVKDRLPEDQTDVLAVKQL